MWHKRWEVFALEEHLAVYETEDLSKGTIFL